MIAGQRNPRLALNWWPYSATARAAAASAMLQERPGRQGIAAARALALAALRREPVNAIASRTAGFTAMLSGDAQEARRFFEYSESLSRRDLPTQLWLIEDKVQRNDINGALRHYDRALRVSSEARSLLIPILVQASADRAIALPLSELLKARPLWWSAFVDALITEGRSPAALAFIVHRLRLRPDDAGERERLAHALSTLAGRGAIGEAYAIYRDARPEPERSALLRNGGFESGDSLGPFDWWLVDESGLAAVRERRDGSSGDFALSLVAGNGRGGEVARQLLVLRPGRYRLTMRAGDIVGDPLARPIVQFACARGQQTSLAQIRLPTATSGGSRIAETITVPSSGCEAQLLTISTGSLLEQPPVTPWVDGLALTRM